MAAAFPFFVNMKAATAQNDVQPTVYLTFFNLPRPATATATTASRLRSQKLHIVLWGLQVGLVL